MLHYYTKAILLYNFYYTFRNFYFRKVFVVSLMGIDLVSIFTLLILVEVESNILDIFSRFCS